MANALGFVDITFHTLIQQRRFFNLFPYCFGLSPELAHQEDQLLTK
ncbi:MAG: hypothetical protein WBA93_28285 [Microcoleaceae cyanobacterium]